MPRGLYTHRGIVQDHDFRKGSGKPHCGGPAGLEGDGIRYHLYRGPFPGYGDGGAVPGEHAGRSAPDGLCAAAGLDGEEHHPCAVVEDVGAALTKEAVMSDPVFDEIKKLIEGNRIALFMKGTPEMPRCGFSAGVVEVLQKHNAPFAAMDMLPEPHIRQAHSAYSNWPTIPQRFILGKIIGGSDSAGEVDANVEPTPPIKCP